MSADPRRAGSVALIGRPNVGKSTLLNRLLGRKVSIVSDKPQTTRCQVQGVLERPSSRIVLIDTPGIHRPLHRLNERMLNAALSMFHGVDVIAVLTDVTESFGSGDRYLVGLLASVEAPVFLVVNKLDRIRPTHVLPVMARWSQYFAFREIHPISALTGDGVEPLVQSLESYLPVLAADARFDDPEVMSRRFLISELIREKLLLLTRDEVPYTTAVLVERIEEPETERQALRIEATIICERASQKGILLGKGGERIKQIGTQARLELEPLLGRRILLLLHVDVQPGWRDRDRLLDRLLEPQA